MSDAHGELDQNKKAGQEGDSYLLLGRNLSDEEMADAIMEQMAGSKEDSPPPGVRKD